MLILGVCAPLVVFFDAFLVITSASFLSGFVTWLVAVVLPCYSLFALFVDMKFSCPVSFLFSLLHWAPGLSSIVFSSILVSYTGHQSACFVDYLNSKTLCRPNVSQPHRCLWVFGRHAGSKIATPTRTCRHPYPWPSEGHQTLVEH